MVKEIRNFNDYISWIKRMTSNDEEIWFRGQSDDRWSLQPKLYRNSELNIKKNSVSLLKFKKTDFVSQFAEFKEVIKQIDSTIEELNDMQYLFLAQHHGLQTPLLDWSIDPLVALYFALDGYEDNEVSSPCIYILRAKMCNRYSSLVYEDGGNILEPLCIDNNILSDFSVEKIIDNRSFLNGFPMAIYSKIDFSHRISRQSGKFTVHGPIYKLPNTELYNYAVNGVEFGDKIIIHRKAVFELRDVLDKLSITKDTIYRLTENKLDSICEELDKKYKRQD